MLPRGWVLTPENGCSSSERTISDTENWCGRIRCENLAIWVCVWTCFWKTTCTDIRNRSNKQMQPERQEPENVAISIRTKRAEKKTVTHVQAHVVKCRLELSTVHNFWTVSHTSRHHKSAYLYEPYLDLLEMPSQKFLRSCTTCFWKTGPVTLNLTTLKF